MDAPVSNGPDLAERGQLAILAGGAEPEAARARPVFDALGRVTRMGEPGAEQTAKVLNHALVGVGYVEAAEVLALARRAGIDPTQLPPALAGGMADSQVPQMKAEDFDRPKAHARQLAEDPRALRAFVEAHGGGRPLIARTAELYEAHAKDHPKEDSAAISLR